MASRWQSQQGHAAVHGVLAAANGGSLPAVAGQPGVGLSYNNPRQSIREDFGTLRSDYVKSDRDTISAAYTLDDGANLLPLADPLFGSNVTLRSQVASLQETHIFSPTVLNTFTAGFSRAAFNYDSFPLTTFPASLSFVTGVQPGGITIGGGVTTTGGGSITAAGAQQCGQCVESAQSIYLHGHCSGYERDSSVERGCVAAAHAG